MKTKDDSTIGMTPSQLKEYHKFQQIKREDDLTWERKAIRLWGFGKPRPADWKAYIKKIEKI